MEFIRICHENNFHEIVVSMKSSNPQVMIHAYRLLVKKMDAENMHYPLHLGVTEAGDGEDGRMRFRSSYGQNLLMHSRETANLCATMAAELGLKAKFAKRAGLLHDYGQIPRCEARAREHAARD